ncbi:50S ribosomal protein L18 [Bienertia sinuspersici]
MDFNLMLVSSEKKGGLVFKSHKAEIFREAIRECTLEDLGFIGYDFTWSNNRGGEHNKDLFGGSYVTHLPKRESDHLPILVRMRGRLGNVKERKRRKLFRVEEMWLRDELSNVVINGAWIIEGDVKEKISGTAASLRQWSSVKFGNFNREMHDCKNQIGRLMRGEQTTETISQMKALDD